MADAYIRINDADLKRAARVLGERAPFAFARSINRALVTTRTVMVRHVKSDTGLKEADVQREVTITNARPTALGSTSGRVMARGSRIPLVRFQARGPEPTRGKGRGVSWKLRGGRNRLQHAFIATTKSGHRGVFKRKGAMGRGSAGPNASTHKSRGAWSANLPIQELHGPSIAHVFHKHSQAGLDAGTAMLSKTLEHEISRALDQASVK